MVPCPAGHDSTTTDFCDVCGAALDEVLSPVVPKVPPAQPCPVCGAGRTGRFCEACGYDFISGTPPGQIQGRWLAVVTADRAYYETVVAAGGPDAAAIALPAYCPERRFALTGEQVRIGRRSASRGVCPEIDLSGLPEDPGVSHLHAVLLARPGGGWAVLDPGSTNGTTLNDDPEPIRTNVAVPLAEGDRIHLGAWTTITLQQG
jgi:FHA domain